jgi:hypothetical protein
MVYSTAIKNKKFNYDRYFEATIEDNIKYVFPFDDININKFIDIFNRELLFVYNMSIKNAEMYLLRDISNRKELFKYWAENKKTIVAEIVEIYLNK